jgi:hypothetical protein
MTASETRQLLSSLTDDELRDHIAGRDHGPFHRHLARQALRLREQGRAGRFSAGELVSIGAAAGLLALAIMTATQT